MANEISEISERADELIDQVNYRGFSFSVWLESVDRGNTRMYYTIVAGKRVNICFSEFNYRDFIYKIIDRQLDQLYAWGKDTYLVKFLNGEQFDVELVHRNRILKVFLVEDWNSVKEEYLISESVKILKKLNIL